MFLLKRIVKNILLSPIIHNILAFDWSHETKTRQGIWSTWGKVWDVESSNMMSVLWGVANACEGDLSTPLVT